jgi:hypothetical protein
LAGLNGSLVVDRTMDGDRYPNRSAQAEIKEANGNHDRASLAP